MNINSVTPAQPLRFLELVTDLEHTSDTLAPLAALWEEFWLQFLKNYTAIWFFIGKFKNTKEKSNKGIEKQNRINNEKERKWASRLEK